MRKNNKKNDNKNSHVIFNDRMFNLDEGNATSVNDCTGLIPSAPHTKEELEAYDEIVSYSPESANIFNHD